MVETTIGHSTCPPHAHEPPRFRSHAMNGCGAKKSQSGALLRRTTPLKVFSSKCVLARVREVHEPILLAMLLVHGAHECGGGGSVLFTKMNMALSEGMLIRLRMT